MHELRAFMDGFNRTLAERCAPGTAGAVQDQRAVRDVARRRRACRRLHRRRRPRPRYAGAPVEGRARRVRDGRAPCSTVRPRCPTAPSTTSRVPRRPRSTSRRTSRTCCTTTSRPRFARGVRLAPRNAKDERKAIGHRRAVLLQDAQEGARPVQGAALGSAGDDVKAAIATAYDAKFEFLFTQLAVGNTADGVRST